MRLIDWSTTPLVARTFVYAHEAESDQAFVLVGLSNPRYVSVCEEAEIALGRVTHRFGFARIHRALQLPFPKIKT